MLFGSWLVFCLTIDWLGTNVSAIAASKLQPDEKTDDPTLRASARALVTTRWLEILTQTLLFAPLLKAAFPLRQRQALSAAEYGVFFATWFVSNDLLFTVFHRSFHESPWLYRLAHKQHHAYTAPFAWMSHAMSATEAAANGARDRLQTTALAGLHPTPTALCVRHRRDVLAVCARAVARADHAAGARLARAGGFPAHRMHRALRLRRAEPAGCHQPAVVSGLVVLQHEAPRRPPSDVQGELRRIPGGVGRADGDHDRTLNTKETRLCRPILCSCK